MSFLRFCGGARSIVAPSLATLALILSFVPTQSEAQASPSGGASPAASSSPAGGGAQSGITAGNLSIESTLLAYQSLTKAAQAMADATFSALPPVDAKSEPVIVIGTATDIAAMIQLPVVIQQATILKNRLDALATRLVNATTSCPVPPAPAGGGGHGAHAAILPNFNFPIAGPADLATLLQTISTITAINETVTSASAALNDASLQTLVASGFPNTLAVYVPSAYPPNLTNPNIGSLTLVTTITNLETSRSGMLQKADIMFQKCPNGVPSSANNDITQTLAAVDAFEAALFSGQGSATVTVAGPAQPPATGNTGGASPGGTTGAAPAGATPSSGTPAGGAPATPAPVSASASPGTSLSQLLYAALMLQVINAAPDTDKPAKKVFFLAVHALESGGSQLTKQNVFMGSRLFFSGGAVGSFTLFAPDGREVCKGLGYGYRGFIQARDVSSAIASLDSVQTSDGAVPATVASTFGVPKAKCSGPTQAVK